MRSRAAWFIGAAVAVFVAVAFVAHWCPHCQYEVPVLVRGSDVLPPELDVVAVATTTDPTRPN